MKKRTDEWPSARAANVARASIPESRPVGIVAAGEHSAGFVTFDDLGRPCWSWANEFVPGSDEAAADEVQKALETDALSLADEPGAAPIRRSGKDKGYDPYDTARIKVGDRFRHR